MPAISKPTALAARAAIAATSGCTSLVQSNATFPFRWMSTSRPAGIMLSAAKPWRLSSSRAAESMRTGLSGCPSPRPRRGSELICEAMSSVTVCLPSPVTLAICPLAAAASLPPTTSSRCSLPRINRSTNTPEPSSTATLYAASISC